MGFPAQVLTVPGHVDLALAERLEAATHAEADERTELRSLLAGGPGRAGQLTATAWIFDARERLILLARHRVLGWSNPGGHVEPDESPIDAATREAFEETGVHVVATTPNPVSVHARLIPARGHDPAHLHWNLGYQFVADATTSLLAESGQPVGWWPVGRLPHDRVDDLQEGVERILRREI
jgi:8-oxo-dGTP pyrophosphatase MutT (NUDIX family)